MPCFLGEELALEDEEESGESDVEMETLKGNFEFTYMRTHRSQAAITKVTQQNM